MPRELRIGWKRAAWTLAVLAGLALAGMSLSSCAGRNSSANEGKDAEAATVLGENDVAAVVRTDLASGVPVSGNLKPDVDVQVTSPYPELLDEVPVREGQSVQRGQVLAKFRTSAIAPAAASADAHLASARSDFERMRNLYREGAVSQRDVESAEAAFKAAQSAAAYARKQLEEATVRAPVSGVVATRVVQAGDRVKDGVLMFEVVNTAQFEFDADVPSEHIAKVRVGAPVVLTVTGYGQGPVTGHVARVNAEADPTTRQVRVYVQVPNPGGRLVGGLFASGRVVTAEARAALAVPRAGVRTGPVGHAYVWVVDRGHIARREVTVGLVDEGRDLIEIRSGLSAGETAVIGPAESLKAGLAVRIAGQGA